MRLRATILCICFGWLAGANAGYGQSYGNMIVETFTHENYQNHPQNWGSVVAPNGMYYFANTNNLLEYDGVRWVNYPLGKSNRVRSIDADSLGNIYVGSSNDFGCFRPDPESGLKFFSFLEGLNEKQREFGDVWRTFVIGDKVFFQTDAYIFVCKVSPEPEKETITVLSPRTSFHSAFKSNGRLFVRQRNIGLQEYDNGSFRLAPGGEFFASRGVTSVVAGPNGNLMASTRLNGIFINKGGGFVPFAEELNTYFSKYQIYTLIQLSDGNYAAATLLNGVLILSPNGEILDVVNTRNGLNNNTVWHLMQDKNGNIWCSLDNGISMIRYQLPFNVVEENVGFAGGANDVAFANGVLYAASSQDLYVQSAQRLNMASDDRTPPIYGSIKFSAAVSGIYNKCWDLETINDRLYCINSDGLHVVNGGAARRVFSCYGYTIKSLEHYENIVLLGLREGLTYIEITPDGNVRPKGLVPGIFGEIRKIAEISPTEIWVETAVGSFIKLTLNPSEGLASPRIEQYDSRAGLPETAKIYLQHLGSRIFACTPKGLYEYNREQNKFETSSILGGRYANSMIVGFDVIDDQVWIHGYRSYVNNQKIHLAKSYNFLERFYIAEIDQPDKVSVIPVTLLKYGDLKKIVKVNNKIWICAVKGLALYKPGRRTARQIKAPRHAFVRMLHLNADTSLFLGAIWPGKTPLFKNRINNDGEYFFEIPYEHRSVLFNLAVSDNPGLENFYQYKLENHDDQWSEWSPNSAANYFSLPHGDYVFRVRAKNVLGQKTGETMLTLRVKTPPFLSWWAISLYILGACLLGFLAYKSVQMRQKEKIEGLEKRIQERTAQIEAQKEELEIQASQLKAYSHNVATLSIIGQEITGYLDFEVIFNKLYDHVRKLVNLTSFGIHIVEPEQNELVCKFNVENEKRLPEFAMNLVEDDVLAVWCVNNRKEVVISDYETEYAKYIKSPVVVIGEFNRTIVYLPLYSKDKLIGAFTAQHKEANAFNEQDVEILRTLASYTAIALDNAAAYQTIDQVNQQVEHQNEAITDSILYAKRIQEAILPSIKHIQRTFPDSFIFYEPREIVSGDFYWFSRSEQYAIFAVVDCTGHGVPGAFMAVLGNSLLDQIVNVRGAVKPNEILNELNHSVMESLNQYEKGSQMYDGMDIALCTFDLNNRVLHFSGANRPLYYARAGKELEEIRGDKFAIGGRQHMQQVQEFTLKSVEYAPDDAIYLTTDGYPDQFGGPRKMKFLNKRLKRLIADAAGKPMREQRELFKKAYYDWRGENKQIDDILVWGCRLDVAQDED